jgi:hypothetical protein
VKGKVRGVFRFRMKKGWRMIQNSKLETPRPRDLVTIQDSVEAEPVDGSMLAAKPAEGTERKEKIH